MAKDLTTAEYLASLRTNFPKMNKGYFEFVYPFGGPLNPADPLYNEKLTKEDEIRNEKIAKAGVNMPSLWGLNPDLQIDTGSAATKKSDPHLQNWMKVESAKVIGSMQMQDKIIETKDENNPTVYALTATQQSASSWHLRINTDGTVNYQLKNRMSPFRDKERIAIIGLSVALQRTFGHTEVKCPDMPKRHIFRKIYTKKRTDGFIMDFYFAARMAGYPQDKITGPKPKQEFIDMVEAEVAKEKKKQYPGNANPPELNSYFSKTELQTGIILRDKFLKSQELTWDNINRRIAKNIKKLFTKKPSNNHAYTGSMAGGHMPPPAQQLTLGQKIKNMFGKKPSNNHTYTGGMGAGHAPSPHTNQPQSGLVSKIKSLFRITPSIAVAAMMGADPNEAQAAPAVKDPVEQAIAKVETKIAVNPDAHKIDIGSFKSKNDTVAPVLADAAPEIIIAKPDIQKVFAEQKNTLTQKNKTALKNVIQKKNVFTQDTKR